MGDSGDEENPLLGGEGWSSGRSLATLDREGMVVALAPYWWVFLFRGLVIVTFGLFCILSPDVTLLFLTYLFAWFLMFDGVACLGTMLGNYPRYDELGRHTPRGLPLLNAICDFTIGIYTFAYPEVTEVLLLILFAVWFLVTGVLEMISAVVLRRELTNQEEWFLGIAGFLSALLGILMLVRPSIGVLAFVNFIGVIAIVFGTQTMFLGSKLKEVDNMIRQSG